MTNIAILVLIPIVLVAVGVVIGLIYLILKSKLPLGGQIVAVVIVLAIILLPVWILLRGVSPGA